MTVPVVPKSTTVPSHGLTAAVSPSLIPVVHDCGLPLTQVAADQTGPLEPEHQLDMHRVSCGTEIITTLMLT